MTRASCLCVACCGLIAAIVSPVVASEQAQRPVLPQEVRQQQVQAEKSALSEAERQDQSQQSLKQLYQRAKETHGLITVLQQNAKSYFANMETLLDSDRGKRLARDPVAVRLFEGLHKYPAVSLREISDRLDAASALANRLEMLQSGAYVDYVPNQQTQDQINELYFWADDRTRSLATNLSVLNDILKKTPEGSVTADDKTLRVILDEIEAAFYKILVDHRMKGQEKAAPVVEKMVVDAAYFRQIERARAEEEIRTKEVQAEVLRKTTQAEAALLQQQAQSQRERSEAEIKYKDALAEIERLKQQADVKRTVQDTDARLARDKQLAASRRKEQVVLARSSEVTRLLAPFLTPGYWQPGLGEPTYDKGPVSLKRLIAEGALEKSADGLQKLLWIAQDPGDQARPRWGFGPSVAHVPPSEYEQIRKAQQYLIELGEVMVAEGMLAE